MHAFTFPALVLVTLGAARDAHAGCPPPTPLPGVVRIVVTPADGGPGSLRHHLGVATFGDTIRFDPSVCGDFIPVGNPLPALNSGRVRIDGCVTGDEVTLIGSAASGDGLTIASDGNEVCGVRLTRFPGAGIRVRGGLGNRLAGNIVHANDGPGVLVDGVQPVQDLIIRDHIVGRTPGGAPEGNCANAPPGQLCAGILIAAGPNPVSQVFVSDNEIVAEHRDAIHVRRATRVELSANFIGRSGPNLMGNAGNGIALVATDTVLLEANYVIGSGGAAVHATRARALLMRGNKLGADSTFVVTTNGAGIVLDRCDAELRHNTVAGHTGHGLEIVGKGHVVALSNTFGLETPLPIGNGGDGIRLAGRGGHRLGGPDHGNTIAYNGGAGIRVVDGTRNTFSHNRLVANVDGAIRIAPGAQDDIAPPAIVSVVGTVIDGVVVGRIAPSHQTQDTRAGAGVIELFWSDGDPLSAATWLATLTVAAGAESFEHEYTGDGVMEKLPDSAVITATFTDSASGTTSALGESCDGADQDRDGDIDEDFDWDHDNTTTCGIAHVDGAPIGLVDHMDCYDDQFGVTDDLDNDTFLCGHDDCCDGNPGYACNTLWVPPVVVPWVPTGCVAIDPMDCDGDGAGVALDCDDFDATKNLLDSPDGDGLTTCAGDCDDVDPSIGTCVPAATHVIDVDEFGNFDPRWTFIHPGDTVRWNFTAVPGRSPGVTPVVFNGGAGPELCSAFKAWSAPDDLTGPQVHLASGIFVMGKQDTGYVEETWDPNPLSFIANGVARSTHWRTTIDVGGVPTEVPACCSGNIFGAEEGDERLCATGPAYATMDSTWSDPDITGVFLRIGWRDLERQPNTYDFTALDREIEKALANGKLYSLVVTPAWDSLPDWLTTRTWPSQAGPDIGPVDPITLSDTYGGGCGDAKTIPNMLDPDFQTAYFDLLENVASHLKSKSAYYRALVYIKLAGANTVTDETRLPRTCDLGCDICNTEVWANDPFHPYTPSALYAFFDAERAHLKAHFPGKETSYMLIYDAYPRISDAPTGSWQTCYDPAAVMPCTLGDPDCCPAVNPSGPDPIPKANEQTEAIIARGLVDLGVLDPLPVDCVIDNSATAPPWACTLPSPYDFVVQHNGVRPHALDNTVAWAGANGYPSALQTANDTEDVATPLDLQETLVNMRDGSDAFFLEIYEKLLWRAQHALNVLDASDPGVNSIAEWVALLDQRRDDLGPGWPYPEAYPAEWEYTFSTDATPRYIYYVDPSTCGDGGVAPVHFGVIAVVP